MSNEPYTLSNEPYTLTLDGKLQGFYATFSMALHAAQPYEKAYPKPSVKIYYEGSGHQHLVHEE